MKKTLIALAALSAIAGAAQAQSSVTLYGRLDAGLAQQKTEITTPIAQTSLSQNLVTSSALNTTFWGLKGSEDLGGGMTANFKLESQFAIDTGIASSSMFEREATVGLASSFGSVNLGRQYTSLFSLFSATNNVYDTNVATTNTVWATGLTQFDHRTANSIRYDSPVFGGVSGSISMGLGENKVAAATLLPEGVDAARNLSLHVKYAAGPLLVGYAHQDQKVQTPTVTPTATATTKYDLVGASYDFGVAKLTGSYNQAKNDTRKDKEYQFGVSVPFGAAAVAAGYSNSDSTGAGQTDLSGKGFTLAGTYSLSKRTTLYAGYMNSKVESFPVTTPTVFTTTKVTTYAAGVRHTF